MILDLQLHYCTNRIIVHIKIWRIYLTITSTITKKVDGTFETQKQCTLKETFSLPYYPKALINIIQDT